MQRTPDSIQAPKASDSKNIFSVSNIERSTDSGEVSESTQIL